MRGFSIVWIVSTLLCLSSAGAADAAARVKAVASRSFVVKVAPADAMSRDARSADLYQTRFLGSAWTRVGACDIQRDGEEILFSATVNVPGDGVYYYTSRASDAAGQTPPPTKQDRAQVKVIVDTGKPVVAIHAPLGKETIRSGRRMRIQWSAQDGNMKLRPMMIRFALDAQGKEWKTIREGEVNDGEEICVVPASESGLLWIRVEATDVAGNVGVAQIQQPLQVIDPAVRMPVKTAEPVKPEVAVTTTSQDQADGQKDASGTEWMHANNANVRQLKWKSMTPVYSAYINWIVAGNLIRQGRVKDSLRYLQTAVTDDPEFDQAWNDAALVYKEIGEFERALQCNGKALGIEAEEPAYYHTRGEIYQMRFHTQGISRLADSPRLSFETGQKAHEDVHWAVKNYGKAIEYASRHGRLAEQAGSFFRLGEVCYYINHDPVGARQYWQKVVSLHTPIPDLDTVMYDEGTPQESDARNIYEHYTHMRVELEAWQEFARMRLGELVEMERQGLIQFAPNGGDLAGWHRRTPEARREMPSIEAQTAAEPAGAFHKEEYGNGLAHEDYIAPAMVKTKEVETAPAAASSSSTRNFFHWPIGKQTAAPDRALERYDESTSSEMFQEYQRQR